MVRIANGRAKEDDERRLTVDFGWRLRWLREAMERLEPGMHAQYQWAKMLAVTQPRLSRWEQGDFLPPISVIWRIVNAMGCTWDYLFAGILSPKMPAALLAELRSAHPADLKEEADFYRERDEFRAAFEAIQRVQPRTAQPQTVPPRPRRLRRRKNPAGLLPPR